MEIRIRKIYQIGNIGIEFVKAQCPGFSHRVIISDTTQGSVIIAKDWLSDKFKPSAYHAEFYYRKHIK